MVHIVGSPYMCVCVCVCVCVYHDERFRKRKEGNYFMKLGTKLLGNKFCKSEGNWWTILKLFHDYCIRNVTPSNLVDVC